MFVVQEKTGIRSPKKKRYGHTGARKRNLGGRNANQHFRRQNYVRCACEMQEQNEGFGRCASDYDDNRKITFCDVYIIVVGIIT